MCAIKLRSISGEFVVVVNTCTVGSEKETEDKIARHTYHNMVFK